MEETTYTYEQLLEESRSEAHFWCRKNGGMLLLYNRSNRQRYLVNTHTRQSYQLTDTTGRIVAFGKKDMDYRAIESLPYHENAYLMQADYYFSVEDFDRGVALVVWTLYPDGRYFADEDGFGGSDNDEVNIYAYIDQACKVLIPFRPMTESQKKEEKRRALSRRKWEWLRRIFG